MAMLLRLRFVPCLLVPLALPVGAQEVGGDPDAGETAFRQCAGCHALDAERNGAGPHLVGVIGRAVGSVEGFRYSDALAAEDAAWDAERLIAYLTAPNEALPGTRKTMPPQEPRRAADIAAYLASRSR